MSLRGPLTLIATVLLLSSISAASAFNITKMLEKYPDFSNFNSLLSQTGLATEINRRKTITVLALTNSNLGELNGKPQDIQKRMLSTHVVLDYYDVPKLNKLKDKKTTLTTLYQTSGIADDRQGFVSVGQKDGKVAFGSAMKGSSLDSTLLGSVISQPYNVSVLSISQPIIANGIDGVMRPMAAPAPNSGASAPTAEGSAPEAEAPIDETADAPTTADAPGPAEADAPATDASKGNAPAADADTTAASAPSSAAPGKLVSGATFGLVALVSFLAAQ